MADAVAAQGKPLVVQTIYPDSPASQVLRAAGIPVHRDVDRACTVLAGLVEPDDGRARRGAPGSRAARHRHVVRRGAGAVRATPASPSPPRCRSTDAAGLEAALDAPGLGFPVVLKATGRLHKSEGGGVVVGLADRDAARAAYADLVARLAPPAVSVEAMADLADGVELIVGSVRDPKFGPVVMVGLGGVFTEVLGDTACAIAPVSADAARELLLSLQGAPLLLGARGRAPVDLDALADAGRPRLAPRGRPPRARRAGAQPGARRPRRGRPRAGRAGRPRAARSVAASDGLDVAQVALVELVDPAVLGREDAVLEGP